MALVLGPHHSFTTAGVHSISKPLGLAISLSNIAPYVAHDPGEPNVYRRIGAITLGNDVGWLPEFHLSHLLEFMYPLPDELTLMAIKMDAGITIDIDEIVRPAVAIARLAPWDRNATMFQQYANPVVTPPTALLSGYTYTVPAGKILMLESASARCSKLAVSTTPGRLASYFFVNGVLTLLGQLHTNVLGDKHQDALTAPLYLPAGTVLLHQYRDQSSDGSPGLTLTLSGLLFDA